MVPSFSNYWPFFMHHTILLYCCKTFFSDTLSIHHYDHFYYLKTFQIKHKVISQILPHPVSFNWQDRSCAKRNCIWDCLCFSRIFIFYFLARWNRENWRELRKSIGNLGKLYGNCFVSACWPCTKLPVNGMKSGTKCHKKYDVRGKSFSVVWEIFGGWSFSFKLVCIKNFHERYFILLI